MTREFKRYHNIFHHRSLYIFTTILKLTARHNPHYHPVSPGIDYLSNVNKKLNFMPILPLNLRYLINYIIILIYENNRKISINMSKILFILNSLYQEKISYFNCGYFINYYKYINYFFTKVFNLYTTWCKS